MRKTHTVSGSSSLQQVLGLRRGTRIRVALPTLSLVQQENLEARFNLQLSESGGAFCAVALIAALVGCILFDAAHWPLFVAHASRLIAANVLVCLAAAIFGKTFGVLRARWQLARLIWAVAELIDDGEAHTAPLGPVSGPRGERFATRDRGLSGLSRISY